MVPGTNSGVHDFRNFQNVSNDCKILQRVENFSHCNFVNHITSIKYFTIIRIILKVKKVMNSWICATDHFLLQYKKKIPNWWICTPSKFGNFSKNPIFWKKMSKIFKKIDFQQKFNRLQIHQFWSCDNYLWCKSLLFGHANRLMCIL